MAGSPVARVLLGLIRGYQKFVSPALPPTCRFYPSCSTYAATAIELHGPIRGCWLAVRRLARCHPWRPGGFDPVPAVRPVDDRRREPDTHLGSCDLVATTPDPVPPGVPHQMPGPDARPAPSEAPIPRSTAA